MNYQLKSRQVQIAMDAASGLYETQTRFDICDATGKVLDNAQGYGYKTAQSEHKAAAYKFKGGRAIVRNVRVELQGPTIR